MTTPTQAQIEAAAEAMHRYDIEHGLNIDGLASVENYLPIATAALTAAVGGANPVLFLTKQLADKQRELDATIERCAQVAHDWLAYHGYDIEAIECAAAIRTLKEQQ